MFNHFIAIFMKAAKKQYSLHSRVIILITTTMFIFLFFPFLYLYTGSYIQCTAFATFPTTEKFLIALPLLLTSSAIIIWTLVLQYSYAKGSGSHIIPTQKLIVFGPYKLCRHPMVLSAALLYFATGLLFSTLFVAFYGAFATLIMGYFFVIYIEEPLLIARFGNNYKQYQAQVPLIPFFTWKL